MKTRRLTLLGEVVSPFILFVSLVTLPLEREVWTTAAMFPDREDTFEFTNNETEEAYDLHIDWSRQVNVKQMTPFKKQKGSGTNKTDLSNGVVKPTEKASVTVTWDGTAPTVKQWWWTKQSGDRLGKVKTGNPTTPRAQVTPSSTTRDGLRVVTFDTLQGRVIVNLPDDMRAGDTISGTVVAEPKGQTPEERARNMAIWSGYVIEVQPPRNPDGTSNPKVRAEVTAPIPLLRVTLPPSSTLTPPLKSVSSANSSGLGITLTNTTGSFTTGGTTTVPIEMISLSLQSVEPLKVPQLPSIGQQGRPIEIIGPFDGNITNTRLMYGPAGSSIQDFEKNTENVTGGFGLLQPLAESPRKCVLAAPTNVTGPIELYLKEGNKETKGTFRDVGVNLTAPKTSLLKGESTELHVEVNGLQGITEPIPLHLTKGGVVTMQGGDVQTIRISPSDVNAYGTYTTTRTITGVQAGAWNSTATVVVFNVCLQDDKTGDRLQFNSTTGDYIFCVFPSVVAGDPGRVNISWYGTTTPDTGSVGWSGCIITLQHNSTDGRVTAQTDRCTQTGSATVQPASSKITFTITDRDMRNNTCTCGGGPGPSKADSEKVVRLRTN
jgi:hypothetical protein